MAWLWRKREVVIIKDIQIHHFTTVCHKGLIFLKGFVVVLVTAHSQKSKVQRHLWAGVKNRLMVCHSKVFLAGIELKKTGHCDLFSSHNPITPSIFHVHLFVFLAGRRIIQSSWYYQIINLLKVLWEVLFCNNEELTGLYSHFPWHPIREERLVT